MSANNKYTKGVFCMELGDRKRKILQAIVEDYIENAEPIGSRTIAKHIDMGLSSATVRNEMADLEDMGYLISPHTSSGRVPTDLGYRFYVNELMSRYDMAMADVVKLRRLFTAGVLQIDRLIRQASDIVSNLTSYTAVAVTPELKKSYVKHFELVLIDEKSALLVLVTNEGIVKNQLINVSGSAEELREFSRVLNERLAGLTIEQINLSVINDIQKTLNIKPEMLMPILEFVHQSISELNGSEVYVSGRKRILLHPEYKDIVQARNFLELLDDKETLKHAVDQGTKGDGIKVIIGNENDIETMKDASIVTATYTSGGRTVGKLGIVGPTRMDYAKVVSSLDIISKSLDSIIDELYNEEKGSEDFGKKE